MFSVLYIVSNQLNAQSNAYSCNVIIPILKIKKPKYREVSKDSRQVSGRTMVQTHAGLTPNEYPIVCATL